MCDEVTLTGVAAESHWSVTARYRQSSSANTAN